MPVPSIKSSMSKQQNSVGLFLGVVPWSTWVTKVILGEMGDLTAGDETS